MGKYLITSSVLISNIKKALNAVLDKPGGQAIGIGLGVALIALGSLIEKNIPKLATGGIVTSPTRALIGESGPEAVIPLGRVPGLLNDNSNGGTVVFRISGNELRGILQRANTSASRIG